MNELRNQVCSSEQSSNFQRETVMITWQNRPTLSSVNIPGSVKNGQVVVRGLLKEFSLPDCLHSISLSSCPLSRKQEKLLTSLHAPSYSSPASSEIRLLLLIFLMALLCGAVLFCLQCWLRRPRMGSQRHTMAVFAVGDLDPVCGKLSAHFGTSSLRPHGFALN